jgi:hypothetical protein
MFYGGVMKKNASKLFKLILIQLLLVSGLVIAQTKSAEKILNFDDTTKAGVSGTYTFISGENNEPLLKADRLKKEMLSSNVTWYNFSTGVDVYPVWTVDVSNGGDIYIGGTFTVAGGNTVNYISKWNGSNWTALGSGTNGAVYAIAISGTDVYVGGSFSSPGTNIAKWNGSSWYALGSDINGTVKAIAISGSDVYVGGRFYKLKTNIKNIAKWNGSSWSAIGSGVGDQSSTSVFALAISGNNVYAGGDFTSPGNRIAKWNGSSWSALGSGTNGTVYAIAISGTDVYVGGSFTTAGSVSANRIAKWNATTNSWSALGDGVGGTVRAIAISGSDVYVGGDFTTAGGNTANYIAKWNGSSWTTLVDGSSTGVGSSVYALKVDSAANRMVVGGAFTTAGLISANRIASFTDSDNPFPVELTSFTATAIGNHVNLHWTTASEFNNYGFYIERKINDEDWQELTFIEGCGNSQVTKEYYYQDKIETSGIIKYRLKQVDLDGGYKYSSIVEVEMNMPIKYSLSQNYPNPFNPETTINYSIPKASDVKIVIYDVMGKEVTTLINENKNAGNHFVIFNASNLTSGVYFYKIETADYMDVKKMVLIK